MKLAELQQALQAADPAALLVTPRVLAHVIQQECRLPAWLWDVPHRQCYVVDRQALFRHVEQDELELEPGRLLPTPVILLARPSADQLAAQDPGNVLREYWRRLFHAHVHCALEQGPAAAGLSPEGVRQRIEKIGPAEFREARAVLAQDRHLLPPGDDRAAYVEFAAIFLELRYFAPHLLPVYFPAVRERERVERLLTLDIDAASRFARTRPAGALDPVVRAGDGSDEPHDYYDTQAGNAERAARSGNTVRAAILRTRAARVAPAALTAATRVQAHADLQRLTARLQAALQLGDAETGEWLKDLPALLEKADLGRRPVEAALLYDLQQVCLDHEREAYALDLAEWLLSAGKRPVRRPLPGQRLVRPLKRLRSAAQRLTYARLSDVDRQHLSGLLRAALDRAEEQLRDHFRPLLAEALHDVGLQPGNAPERAAFRKVVEELLDRLAEYGFLSFGDLRDTISRNQLKLPDLDEPQDFVRGDALLRLDRRLAVLLDGVYRPGEFYLRFLERFTALGFGTPTGRLLTRCVTVPFGGAFALTEVLALVLEKTHAPPLPFAGRLVLFLTLGLFLLALVNREGFRRRCARLAVRTGRLLHTWCIEMPSRALSHPAVRRLLRSWPFQLFSWYLLKPLLACAVLWLCLPAAFATPARAACTVLAACLLLNTRLGRAAGDLLIQALVGLYHLLRAGLLPGLFRLMVRLFKQAADLVRYVLFSVDEWLYFRSGDSGLMLAVRTVLGLAWFPVSYVLRFYMVVLIEPGINPVKFPISSVAAKFVYPFGVVLTGVVVGALAPLVGSLLAKIVAVGTVWLLPDAFGFLCWEMKENWGLYRANRRPGLRPVPVGAHGETVRRLLQLGFHSGTVPRLYARLRQAEREAGDPGSGRAVRTCRQALQDVGRSLQRFVDRELVALLQESPHWGGQPLSVGGVALASNRIGVELIHGAFPADPVCLEWEQESGWLVAGVRQVGWLDRLGHEGQQQAMILALVGLYKQAGINLVREQIEAHLPPAVSGYEITPRGLVLRPEKEGDPSLLCDLSDPQGRFEQEPPGNGDLLPGRLPDPSRIIFSRVPLSWGQWLEYWREDEGGRAALPLFSPQMLLPSGDDVRSV